MAVRHPAFALTIFVFAIGLKELYKHFSYSFFLLSCEVIIKGACSCLQIQNVTLIPTGHNSALCRAVTPRASNNTTSITLTSRPLGHPSFTGYLPGLHLIPVTYLTKQNDALASLALGQSQCTVVRHLTSTFEDNRDHGVYRWNWVGIASYPSLLLI